MCVKKISISNFKGIETFDADLESINCLIGANGRGKTSTIQALKWALIGSFDVAFLRKDGSVPSVEVTFKDGMKVKRWYEDGKQNASVNGKASTLKDATQLVLETQLHCSPEVADAMFDVKALESYAENPKAFSEFLLSFLPVKVKKESLFRFMEQNLGRPLDSEERSFFDKEINATEVTLSLMDVYYKQFYEDRKLANREVKDLKPKAAFTGTLPKETKEELTERLGVLAGMEKSAADYANAFALYEKSVENAKKAEERKNALEKEILSFGELLLPAESLEVIHEKKSELMEELRKTDKELADSNAALKTFKVAYEGFSSGKCPYMPDGNCPLDHKEIIDSIIRKGTEQKQVSNLAEAKSKELREKIEVLDKQMVEFNRISNQLTRKNALIAERKAFVMPEILPKPEKVEVTNVSAEKADITGKLALIETAAQAKEVEKWYKEVKARADLLDTAVKLFDPKGIKAEILKQTMGPVEGLINKNAAKFGNKFHVTITPTANGEFYPVVKVKGQDVPMDQLSSGEFILVCFLIMEAIREITGVKILVIDNLDKLDKENCKTFIQLIKNGTGYENVFLAGVDHDVLASEAVNMI